ncbi:COG1470 family protein [Streptomyces niveus]|uniref:COG1470 family protein n=1 Tax=Streptomyces niveus TaxID=193462 RepID=UPI0033B2F846
MSLTASLDESSVAAAPGEETALPLQVLNSGRTVEEYRFEVVGACAAWSAVEPAVLSLYPGDSGTVSLMLRPPRDSTVLAGETPFGIRVVPTSQESATVVPEGRVTVLPFTETTAELVPRSSHGSRSGQHRLAVDNRGNTPVTVRLGAQPGTELARVVFAVPELRIEPGRAEFGKLRVRPAKRMWRGTPVTHPFQVFATPRVAEDQEVLEPVLLDGSYQQEPILPRWLPRALVVAAVILIALIGLWYALLRPAVKSAAREAVTPDAVRSAVEADKSASPDEENPDGGGPAGADSAGADSAGGDSAGAGDGTPGSSESPSPGSSADAAATAPTSAQVRVSDSVGGGANTGTALRVPAGQTFELTDIVVQNPQGDAGTVVVSAGPDRRVLSLGLENFRDSDYHFVTPILVPAGGTVTMTIDCRRVGRPVGAPAPARCTESLFLGGNMRPE